MKFLRPTVLRRLMFFITFASHSFFADAMILRDNIPDGGEDRLPRNSPLRRPEIQLRWMEILSANIANAQTTEFSTRGEARDLQHRRFIFPEGFPSQPAQRPALPMDAEELQRLLENSRQTAAEMAAHVERLKILMHTL